MTSVCPALLVPLVGAPGVTGLLPGEPAGWVVPIAAFLLGAAVGWRRCRPQRIEIEGTAIERGASLPRYARSVRRLEAELERSRRSDLKFAILVVKLDPGSVEELETRLRAVNGEIGGSATVQCTIHTVFTIVGAILDECLREIDVATSDPSARRYIVALPESTREQAGDAARRMADLVLAETGVRIRSGVAELGTDGVLLKDLVTAATDACDGREVAAGTERVRALTGG